MSFRKLLMLEPLQCLKDLLKASEEFNLFIGRLSVNETAAEAQIKLGYAEDYTAKAVIALIDLETTKVSTGSFESLPVILLRLERPTPAAERTYTESVQYESFVGACEKVLDGIREDTVGQLDKLQIESVTLSLPPQITDPADDTLQTTDFWRCEFTVTVRA